MPAKMKFDVQESAKSGMIKEYRKTFMNGLRGRPKGDKDAVK